MTAHLPDLASAIAAAVFAVLLALGYVWHVTR